MRSVLKCPHCAAGVAVDQRYCVECGERVRERPARVQATINQMAGASRPAPVVVPDAEPRVSRILGVDMELPSPRSMATSVLMLLAFGVVLGTTNISAAAGSLNVFVHGIFGSNQTVQTTANAGTSGSSGASGNSGTSGTTGNSGAATTTAASTSTTTATAAAGGALPPIKHVWVVMLGDQGYEQTFAAGSQDKYLSAGLSQKGEVIQYYYGTSQGDLANEDALVSGQGPNKQTAANCPKYSAFSPATATANKQLKGQGCVYAKTTPTLMSELVAAKDTWKGYIQGMTKACTHPSLGAGDGAFSASAKSAYTTWRNPFVYFAGVTGSATDCANQDVPLTQLSGDLKSTAKTPNVSFVMADACDDGSDTPCHAGAPAGTAQSDKFLKTVIPEIEASPAYKKDGMILITFAQAPGSGPNADPSSCCSQPTSYPNLPLSAATARFHTEDDVPTTTTDTSSDTTTTATDTTPTTATDTTPSTSTTTPATSSTTTPPATSTATPPATTSAPPAPPTTATTPPATTTTTSTSSTCPVTNTTTSAGTTTTSTTTTLASTTTPTGTGTGTGTGTTSCTTTTTTSTITAPPNGAVNGGGGNTGLLVLSQYVTPGNPDVVDYFNHYSLLLSIEQLFGLKPIGYASASSAQAFSASVYTKYAG